jgi:hemerythrin-like metal-binding protein
MIQWTQDLSVDVKKLDDDHKEIIALINQFVEAVEKEQKITDIHTLFRAMERGIFRHLEVEEEMMRQCAYPNIDAHQAGHEKLSDQLGELWDNMILDPIFRPDDGMRAWLESWLFDHVRDEDFNFRPYMKAAGIV